MATARLSERGRRSLGGSSMGSLGSAFSLPPDTDAGNVPAFPTASPAFQPPFVPAMITARTFQRHEMDVFELIGAPVLVLDPDKACRVLYANAAATSFFGVADVGFLDFSETASEVVESYRNLLRPYAQGIDTSSRQLKGVRNVITVKGRAIYHTEWKCPLRYQEDDDDDGEPMWALALFIVPDAITQDADVTLYQGTVALHYTDSRFWTYNPSTEELVWCNAAAEREMHGKGVASVSLEDHFLEVTQLGITERLTGADVVAMCLDPSNPIGKELMDIELLEPPPGHGPGPVDHKKCTYSRCRAFKVRDRDTGRALLLLQKENITPEKLAQLELEEAVAAKEQKSQFVAQVAHEIRTPLNGLLGFLQVLEEDTTLSPTQSDILSVAVSSGVALFQILTDVLDLSMHNAGSSLTVNNQEVPLSGVPKMLGDVVRLFGRAAYEKGLKLVVDYDPTLLASSEPMVTDLSRIRQVITNLLTNALKYTRQGKVCIRLETIVPEVPTAADQGWLRVDVEDTGIGIAPHKLEDIFKVYFRATDEPAAVTGSCGLGLSITQMLSTLLRGHVSVQSELGRGSTFSFFLPRAPPADYTPQSPVEHSAVFTGSLDIPVEGLYELAESFRSTLLDLSGSSCTVLIIGPTVMGPRTQEFLMSSGISAVLVESLPDALVAIQSTSVPFRVAVLEDIGSTDSTSSKGMDPISWLTALQSASQQLRAALDAAAFKPRCRMVAAIPHTRLPNYAPISDFEDVVTLPLLPSHLVTTLHALCFTRRTSSTSSRGLPRRRASSVSLFGPFTSGSPPIAPMSPLPAPGVSATTNVLIVDDDTPNRILLRRLVAKLLADAHIEEAADGQEAVDAVAARLGSCPLHDHNTRGVALGAGAGAGTRTPGLTREPSVGNLPPPPRPRVAGLRATSDVLASVPGAAGLASGTSSAASSPTGAGSTGPTSVGSVTAASPSCAPASPAGATAAGVTSALLSLPPAALPSGGSSSAPVGEAGARAARSRTLSRHLEPTPPPLLPPSLSPRLSTASDSLSPLPGAGSFGSSVSGPVPTRPPRRLSRSAMPFDVIFCDVEMPIMDGLQAAKHIRRLMAASPEAHLHPVHIVALTGHTYQSMKRKCHDAGFDDVLSKPVVRKQLKQVLASVIPESKLSAAPKRGGGGGGAAAGSTPGAAGSHVAPASHLAASSTV